MRNRLLSFFRRGKKSIRLQLLWAILRSYVLAMIVLILIPNYKDQFPILNVILGLSSFGVAFVSFFVLFTRNITRYLYTLADGLMLIAGGDLSYRFPLSRQDELGVIAQNINYMTERLQTQVERERNVERSKMELITYVSHDLRTPLTSIIGYLDLLKNRAFQDAGEQKRYVDNAFNKSQQLKKLIDDLFEYTRLTTGDVRLAMQIVDLNSLLEQMITEFEPMANEQGVSIDTRLYTAPVLIELDIKKMVRAIDNLLINALKFSIRPGEIKVGLAAGAGRINLIVENFGKPITKEQEEQLFERFYKMEPSRSDKNMPSGSGLGLSIAKNIVELHGGRIWLEYSDGHYKFCIALPSRETNITDISYSDIGISQ